jgi:hypothetical protein
MKNPWRLVIAVAVLAGLGLYLRFGGKKAGSATTPALVTFKNKQVVRIAVDRPGQPQVILDRAGGNGRGKWRMDQPYAAAADSGAVATLLTTASTILPAEKLGAVKDLQPFGLNHPARVSLTLASGTKYTFLLGGKSPTSENVYLKLASSPQIYTVPSYVKTDLEQTAFALQDKSLLDFSADQVNQVTLDYHGKHFQFTRSQGKWPKAEKANLNDLTDAFANAEMDAMISPQGKDPAKYGLVHPPVTVQFTWQGGSGEVLIGKLKSKASGDYYARSGNNPAIYTLNNYLLDDIKNLTKPVKKTAVTAKSHAAKAQAKAKPRGKAQAPAPVQLHPVKR